MSGPATHTNVRHARHSASIRAVIAAGLAVVLAIVWSIMTAPTSASADDYPTWDEVQNARNNQANAEAEVVRVQGLIVAMQAEVERTQQIANEKGQIAFEAEEVHQAKILEVNALQAQADEADALAVASERRAGQWAAQLVRVGGGDPALKLFADGTNADDVLTSIGVSSRISQQAKEESERATQQRNTAQSLSDQAGVMRVELEKLAAAAAAAFAEAQAANVAAAAALSEQQAKVPELEAMVAYLTGVTNDTEAEFRVGEQKRLEAELARIQAERDAANQAIDWAQISAAGWVKPAPGRVTSPYGYSAGYSGHHNGTDLGTGCWAPIIAASSGTVSYAGYYGQLGNWTTIEHGGGVTTGYAHQSQIDVSPGQWVSVGQVIGWSGNTGYSFGCHLHFVVYVWGSRIDPQPFMASMGVWF